MIALKNNLPLLRGTDGITRVIERGWLRASLARAAEQAGYSGWPPTDDLVHSIAFYLEYCYPKNVICSLQLEGAVQTALREIGYGEVAQHFGSSLPWRVSLANCLRDASEAGDANGFLTRVSDYIEAFHKSRVFRFHFYDLQTCARDFCRREIVDFVRAKVESFDWRHGVQCSIC